MDLSVERAMISGQIDVYYDKDEIIDYHECVMTDSIKYLKLLKKHEITYTIDYGDSIKI